MKYILMMHGKTADWDEYAKWSKQDLERNVAFMRSFSKELHSAGVFVDTKGLAWPQQAKIVRCGETWRARYGWRVPGSEGIPCWILGNRRGKSGAGLPDRCSCVRSAWARRGTGKHAD